MDGIPQVCVRVLFGRGSWVGLFLFAGLWFLFFNYNIHTVYNDLSRIQETTAQELKDIRDEIKAIKSKQRTETRPAQLQQRLPTSSFEN
jgi:hypothetical protein